MQLFRQSTPPTIARFLRNQFLQSFVSCLGAFTIAYLVGDVSEHFGDMIKHGGVGLVAFKYLALKVPLIVSQLVPAASLAGVLLCFASMSRNGEVLACQQLGISRMQMAAPVLIAAVVISMLEFALSETVVPLATRASSYAFNVELRGRKLRGIFGNDRIWVRIYGGFLAADRFDAERRELRSITLYRLGPNYDLQQIVTAYAASWDGRSWAARGPTTITMEDGGIKARPIASSRVATPPIVRFGQHLDPGDFSLLRLDPEEFSLWELNRYIRELRDKGLEPGGYVVHRDLKYALPFSCLIMVALGLSLSLDPRPRNLILGRSLGFAILFGSLYWFALGLSTSLGKSGVMPPLVAAWLPNFTFAIIAFSIFLRGEER